MFKLEVCVGICLAARILFVLTTTNQLVCRLHVSEHFSHVDADPHEVALWVLLKRTQSPNKAIRLQAVQELARNHHWHGKPHTN